MKKDLSMNWALKEVFMTTSRTRVTDSSYWISM